MDRETLERLAANPHYKMSAKQLAALRQLRGQPVEHPSDFPRHDTDFQRHDTDPPKGSEQ